MTRLILALAAASIAGCAQNACDDDATWDAATSGCIALAQTEPLPAVAAPADAPHDLVEVSDDIDDGDDAADSVSDTALPETDSADLAHDVTPEDHDGQDDDDDTDDAGTVEVDTDPVTLPGSIIGALILHTAQISDTTPGGSSWDWGLWGHAPDPYAIVRVGGQTVFTTEVLDDTFSPSFDVATPIEVFAGQRLRIHVYDEDTASLDEVIGVFTYEYEQLELLAEAGVFVAARPRVSLGIELAQ